MLHKHVYVSTVTHQGIINAAVTIEMIMPLNKEVKITCCQKTNGRFLTNEYPEFDNALM